ncbi:MAG: hypothetical protein AABN34_25700 [Acidobacteriota bacterium]
MNLLDENIPRRQRLILSSWRIGFREIGVEIGRPGIKDSEIIPLLHGLKSVTFFSLDRDFYKSYLCHLGYCIVYLDVEDYEVADFIRRFLRHPSLDTQAKRAGKVIRVAHTRLRVWRLHSEREQELVWPSS